MNMKIEIECYNHLIREEAANIHLSVAQHCYDHLIKMGKDVTFKKDLELKAEDIKGQDILISLGKTKLLLHSCNLRSINEFFCSISFSPIYKYSRPSF